MTKKFKEHSADDIAGKDFDTFILTCLKSGDEEAFQYLFTRIKPPLFMFVKKMVGSAEVAEDICQETFMTLWTKREKIDESKNIRSYVFGIAKRNVWSYLRKQKRSEAAIAEIDFDFENNLSPDVIIQSEETKLLAEYAISKLPERTREIFESHFLGGLSYDHIAERMDTNTFNVKSRIYDARKRIRKIVCYDDFDGGGGGKTLIIIMLNFIFIFL